MDPDAEIRLRCADLAVRCGGDAQDVAAIAQDIYAFVVGDDVENEQGERSFDAPSP